MYIPAYKVKTILTKQTNSDKYYNYYLIILWRNRKYESYRYSKTY